MKRERLASTTSLDKLFSHAVNEISIVGAGEAVIVKDFFPSDEWGRIGLSERRSLGLKFYRYVQGKGAGSLSPIGKTALKQQIYIRL